MHWQALPATLREEKITEIKGTYRTDKKEREIFLICKEIQMGSVAKS
jgi:hypothetical protein